jgi:hypothetical protein
LNVGEFSLLGFDLTAKRGDLMRQFALSTVQKGTEIFVGLLGSK